MRFHEILVPGDEFAADCKHHQQAAEIIAQFANETLEVVRRTEA